MKTTDKLLRLKYLLRRMNGASMVVSSLEAEFHILIEERYGFHYSDVDLDEIIDTVDYGQGKLPFKDFDRIMLKFKKEKDGLVKK